MDMNGKTVLITGATNGIGKITALELARFGARVLLVSRDAAKLTATVNEIQQATGKDALEVYQGDLSLMADVRRVAEEVRAKHNVIDVLVNNAGAIFTERKITSEGLEMTFALNHMSYFLLTNLLLDAVKAAPEGRIVNVSSEAHRYGRVNFDDLQSTKGFGGMNVYGTSKLMNILFSNALARRLAGTRVTSNALHPGVVATGFAQGSSGVWNFVFGIMRRIPGAMVTPEQGAQTTLLLASGDAAKGITGAYWSNKKIAKATPSALDQTVQERLWTESTRIAGLELPAPASP
jgi:NAD(P)-dependent dehydrogenase (short-subunit alcohol dehydrogenase family)